MIIKLNGYGYSSNSYLLIGKKTILIDPGANHLILENLKKNGIKNIDFVINTHCHFDHSAADHLIEEEFNCPTIIEDKEVKHLKSGDEVTVSSLFGAKLIPPKEIIPLSEMEDELKNYGLEILRTPGHTYGSISIIYEDGLITGDTLFAYGVGRWDLPTGNLIDLRRSISLLENVANERNINKIYPGHGEIGDKMAFNYAKLFL
ncbi:MAG: MBL fold metallo-hydrolase [Methanococci archaeon]|nr:MBL fold metallo-hydrolase [Methanococci archaeon]